MTHVFTQKCKQTQWDVPIVTATLLFYPFAEIQNAWPNVFPLLSSPAYISVSEIATALCDFSY